MRVNFSMYVLSTSYVAGIVLSICYLYLVFNTDIEICIIINSILPEEVKEQRYYVTSLRIHSK